MWLQGGMPENTMIKVSLPVEVPVDEPSEPEQELEIAAEEAPRLDLPSPSEIPLAQPAPEPVPQPPPIKVEPPKPKPPKAATPKPKAKPKKEEKPKPQPEKVVKKTKEPTAESKPKAKIIETAKKPAPVEAAKIAETKTVAAQATPGGQGGTGTASTGPGQSEFGWYHSMIHDRFFSGWEQPTSIVSSSQKFNTVVRIRIEKDGQISNVILAKPSGNVVMDESVMGAAQRVKQIDPLPSGLGGAAYEININFELNQDQS